MAAAPTMATNNDMRKLSFAKVAAAASASKTSASITTVTRAPPQGPSPSTKTPRERQENTVPTMVAPAVPTATPAASLPPSSAAIEQLPAVVPDRDTSIHPPDKIVEALKDLKIGARTPSLIVNGSLSSVTDRSSKAANSHTPSDDNSQRADSGSDLGTKPPSLDGKSITSGTTFALDEKESLRPDDSASVKAAAEDDDAFSIRGSYIAGSRMGSEVAARIHRIQIGDMPPRTITTHVLSGANGQGVATPQSGTSEKQPTAEAKLPLATGVTAPDPGATTGFLSKNPDDKLLEAMQSTKDRIFLLRLEQQVIDFVQDSKEPFMDLPPSNSFCRMLTHKLADYYHMTHSFEAVAGAVRIYRTPFCRIPPSLSSIAASTPSSSSPAPVILPRKIMRRGEDGEFGPSSASPSKATSEAGSDSKDKATSREKLTREEREEEYNRVRQRIFGNTEKTDTPSIEVEDGVSRASSVSGKDRANANTKRKPNRQRRDDSESFDTRSAYVAWRPDPQQHPWVTPQYFPVTSAQFGGQFQQQPYPNTVQPVYGPNPSYPQMIPNNGFPQYNAVPAYPAPAVPQAAPQPPPPPPPAPQQRYPTSNPAPPLANAPYNSPMATVPQPAWTQPAFPQAPFPPAPAPTAARTGSGPSPGIPYAYGQLPVHINPHDPKSQHPIPGSYNRQAFNPKTQSFVPGNGMVPMQPPAAGPFGNSSPLHGSPQFNPSHINYTAGYQQQPLPPQAGSGPYPPAAGYGMARQGSNNSIPQQYHPIQQSPHPPPHMSPNPPVTLTHLPPNVNKGGPVVGHAPPGVVPMQQPQQTFSHLPPAYGNPATLPQKPSAA